MSEKNISGDARFPHLPPIKADVLKQTLDSCIRWPHHYWQKFWTIQNHIQVQHRGRGWQGLRGWSKHPGLPRQGCLHYQSHQTCHLDSRHERRRNSQEDFVVWVFLSPKCLNLMRLIQSVMRFGGGQIFQKANFSVLSVPRTFSTVPTAPSTRTRTRTQVGDLDWGQVGDWMRRSELCERETSLSFIKITQSLIY